MLTSLLRPRRRRQRIDFSSPFTSSPQVSHDRRGRPVVDSQGEEEDNDQAGEDDGTDEHSSDDEDEDDDYEPLLPIFSAAHLDSIPVYVTTHTIRSLIVQKCETTLSWDQLRSPQVSQFMVKPVQQQIRTQAFNRATLLALVANCLQFRKEAETNPGMSGVNKTRAFLAELVAMRLLREYSTRELIDALSYDFDPLQGMEQNTPAAVKQKSRAAGARISTVEISIRAAAKKFLAHPLVVQQLEAIWAGSIVFHSAADNLHRKPTREHQRLSKQRGYGTIEPQGPSGSSGETRGAPNASKAPEQIGPPSKDEYVRRSVTLYNPRDASLFKLSRLRVPRYRHLFSTLSFAVMLGLFLAVLVDGSLEITTLEIIFWFYSAGYMLDEVVGFSEQGFGLYILSVWNAFDLGILCMFIAYYVLRLYGVFIESDRKHRVANMAYDVLASTAILLFPRAFSALDHYRYFSQLLIAFRLMAQDMVAILILIMISCSGFFVAFTLAFTENDSKGPHVAYALFQIVMGFSPAAWNAWDQYNILGRIVLVIFLIICHFLVITILITVLTNSFMAVVQNANEEHQFLFAVNTISMVKSDALFSYIPPTNLLSWVVSPTRFIIPFRQYVRLNRTIIKTTHFPILFSIFVYERLVLSRIAYNPTDLVEASGKAQANPIAFRKRHDPLQVPSTRLREPSVVSFRKNQALAEVFRQPYRESGTQPSANENDMGGRRSSSHVVDTWMQAVGNEGGASPPMEQPQSILDRLERRRIPLRRAMTSDRVRGGGGRVYSTATRSVISDPEDRPLFVFDRPKRIEEETDADLSQLTSEQLSAAEHGDDEQLTHDEGDEHTMEHSSETGESPGPRDNKENAPFGKSPSEYFSPPSGTPLQPNFLGSKPASLGKSPAMPGPGTQQGQQRRGKHPLHDRTASSSTILFSPQLSREVSSSSEAPPPHRAARTGTRNTFAAAADMASPRSHRGEPPMATTRARPILQHRATYQVGAERRHPLSIPPFTAASQQHQPQQRPRVTREPSFATMALDLASDLGDNKFGPSIVDVGGVSGMPASFSEQLFRERELSRRMDEERRRSDIEEKQVLSRVMLTRMNTLEEGFREVISAVREMRSEASRAGAGSERGFGAGPASITRPGTPGGLGTKAKNTAESSGSSALAIAPPRSPGVAKDKRSPKKPRRLQWLRGSGAGEIATEDATAASPSSSTAGHMSLNAALSAEPRTSRPSTPPPTTAAPIAATTAPSDDHEDVQRAAMGLQSPSNKTSRQSLAARPIIINDAQTIATPRDDSGSSGSVKSMVETLERKSGDMGAGRSVSAGSSQLRRVDTATYLPGVVQQRGGDTSAAAAEGGSSRDEGGDVVVSATAGNWRSGDGEVADGANRRSVIFLGKESVSETTRVEDGRTLND